ncbi:hypothetical protein [Microbulbifer pacificus]|uniref:hypothetical protein n=1 Tax=Microbulbifer pacificus TaxID=407164 RepID=UPI000CF48949|nr:hypothetical protein [Microbulbifer pacificus]
MKPRLYSAVLLAAALAVGAQASDHTMEHVEVIGYPAPKAAEQASDGEKHAAQLLTQHRQELLQRMQETQRKQLEAVRLEGATASEETVARETPAQQQEQLAPASAESAPVKLEQPLKLEQNTGDMQPAPVDEDEEALQEPS